MGTGVVVPPSPRRRRHVVFQNFFRKRSGREEQGEFNFSILLYGASHKLN
jgi:hypothetical protein